MSAVVLLAHGSPDPRSGAAVRAAAARLAARSGRPVRAAFLEHDEPRLPQAVSDLGERDVAVLPLLLSRAFHARIDVPRAVAALPRPVEVLDPVGHPPEVLDALLRRVSGPVVVVAAGTAVDAERDTFVAAVATAARRTGAPEVSAAFLTGTGPSPGDRLAEHPDATLVAWLLAPGRLLDSLLEQARAHGSDVLAPDGLLAEPELDTVLLDRLARLRVPA